MKYSEATDWISWLRKNWEKPSTLALILGFVGFSTLSTFYKVDLSKASKQISGFEWTVTLIILFGIIFTWYYSRRPPKFSSGKIGVALAINCETIKERQRLRSDFIEAFTIEIANGNHQNFQIEVLSDYWAEQFKSIEKVKKYHKSINAHLIIFGSCRIRQHQGSPTYVLELKEAVRHKPLQTETKESLEKETKLYAFGLI